MIKKYSFNAEAVTNDCIQWIRDWFDKNGKGCKAVVGISGGKDSSIVAALCVKALGKDRVIGVLMPNGEQCDIDMAKKLIDFLDIMSFEVNIQDAVNGVLNNLPFNGYDISEQTLINLPARIRMATLYAVSQSMNGRVANTCNLSEDWVGYATRYGDAAGDFSPLSKLTVTEVKEIGRILGLPDELIDKVPTDGLCGKADEDNLGFTYAVLDKYIRTGEIENEEIKEKIDAMHEKNLFKLRLMPSYNPPKNNLVYKIGQILVSKQDVEVEKMFGEKVIIPKGNRIIIGGDNLAHHISTEMIQPLGKGISVKGYDSSGLAEYLYLCLSSHFHLDEMLEDYDDTKERFVEELEYALDEIGL